MRRVGAFGLAGLVVLALVSGCSSGRGLANGGTSQQVGPAEGAAKAPAAGGAATQPGSGKDTGKGGSGQSSAGSASARIVPERALIRTADLSVVVDDVRAEAARAEQIAAAAGGEVYADLRSNGDSPDRSTADLVLKVPPRALDDVLDQLSALGREESRKTSTEDVTEQVADVESRVNSAKASLARLRLLYAKAATVGEIVTLEGEVSQREADLESLQARQRALAAQTSDATVSLHLRGKAAAAPPPSAAPSGFGSGLKRGWHAFTVTVGWLLTALGATLPFLALAVLVGSGIWWLRRRRPQPTASSVPAMPPAEGA